jgi:NADPH:quinone reductase-like Zn-dependent oxidoreductase
MFRNGKLPPVLFWTLKTIAKPFLKLFLKPHRIPGMSYSGEIAEIGEKVTKWKVGDKVWGFIEVGGVLTEYRTLPEDFKSLTLMPSNLSYAEAGAVPGGVSPAYTGLIEGINLQKEQKILIIGASGGIGTFAIQIAKIIGAEVTAVCGPNNEELVKKLGADHVIDYTKVDYTKNITKKYDVVFDVVAKINFSQAKRILTKKGIYLSNNPVNAKRHIIQLIFSRRFKTKTANEKSEVLDKVRDWIEAGKMKPVVGAEFSIEETAKAHRLYETGHAKGRIVITIP